MVIVARFGMITKKTLESVRAHGKIKMGANTEPRAKKGGLLSMPCFLPAKDEILIGNNQIVKNYLLPVIELWVLDIRQTVPFTPIVLG